MIQYIRHGGVSGSALAYGAGLDTVYLWNTEGLHFRMDFMVELCRHHFRVWNLGGYHFR